MKSICCPVLALLAVLLAPAHAVNPVEKVLQLLIELEAKVIKDGEAAQKAYSKRLNND